MKAKQGIQLFAAFCILLFGSWAGYDYYQSKNKKQEESSFLDLDLKSLKSFQIFSKGNRLSVLKKNEDWFLTEPLEDLASFSEISRWLTAVSGQKLQKIKTEGIQWEDYGLTDQAAQVELEKSSGEKISFSVSQKSSFDGRRFVKKDNQLFITESNISVEVNDKSFEDFRSKKIMPSLQHASKIEVKGTESFTLNWKDYKWSLENKKPGRLPLDQERLNQFWTALTSLKADKILGSVNKKYNLHRAQRVFNVFYNEKKYQLKISSFQDEKAFASVTGRNFIFEISEDIFLSKKDLYDHSFPFNYKKELAAQIEIQSKEETLKLEKSGEKWMKEAPSKKKIFSKNKLELDSDKVEEFLNQIKQLKALDYKKAQEASPPLRSIQIKGLKEEEIFSLKELSVSKDRSWIKSSLWKDWIAVSTEEINPLFQKNFDRDVKKSESSKEES